MNPDLLLDTHVVVWALADPKRLSRHQRERLLDTRVQRFISVASGWELAIKTGRGRLDLGVPVGAFLAEACARLDASLLGIRVEHLDALATLPDIYRDPFDRMMVAQAIEGSLALVSSDRALDGYNVEVVA